MSGCFIIQPKCLVCLRIYSNLYKQKRRAISGLTHHCSYYCSRVSQPFWPATPCLDNEHSATPKNLSLPWSRWSFGFLAWYCWYFMMIFPSHIEKIIFYLLKFSSATPFLMPRDPPGVPTPQVGKPCNRQRVLGYNIVIMCKQCKNGSNAMGSQINS